MTATVTRIDRTHVRTAPAPRNLLAIPSTPVEAVADLMLALSRGCPGLAWTMERTDDESFTLTFRVAGVR